MDFSFFKNMFASKDDSGKKDLKESAQADAAEASEETVQTEETPEDAGIAVKEDEGGLSAQRRRGGRRQRRPNGRRRERRPQEDSESVAEPLSDEEVEAVMSKLEEFVAYSAKSLVDAPELVSTKVVDREGSRLILVSCDKKDTGKIIGRSGKIIAAIRILVSGAASRRGIKASVDIDE